MEKKIIICEPIAVKPKDIKARDIVGRATIFFAKHLPESVYKMMDFLFADNDGINSYHNRSEWKHDEASLKALYKDLGISRIYNMEDTYIGIWNE